MWANDLLVQWIASLVSNLVLDSVSPNSWHVIRRTIKSTITSLEASVSSLRWCENESTWHSLKYTHAGFNERMMKKNENFNEKELLRTIQRCALPRTTFHNAIETEGCFKRQSRALQCCPIHYEPCWVRRMEIAPRERGSVSPTDTPWDSQPRSRTAFYFQPRSQSAAGSRAKR